jgi:hypothetical protein
MRIVAVVLLLVAVTATAKDVEQDPWLSFVPGSFLLVGQLPEGGSPYAGEARIEARGNGFLMRRTIGGKSIEAAGKIEVPSPPGEGKVLRFRWQEAGRGRTMTCLVASDLDNYARLSCLWAADGESPQKPGLEAYFAAEPWQSGD